MNTGVCNGIKLVKICQLCAVDFTLVKFLLPLVDKQMEDEHNVISVCSDGHYVSGLKNKGYRIDTIVIERSMHPLKHVQSIWKLYWYFKSEQFDIVHVHTPVAALVGRVAAFFARVPFVVYTADGFYFHDDMSWVSRQAHIFLERFAGLFTDLLFTQSEEDAQTAVKQKIMKKHRTFAIGNGVSSVQFTPDAINQRDFVRASFGIPEDAYVIGMIGRQVEEKGIVEFLHAAMTIHRTSPTVYFLLIGDRLDSDYANSVDVAVEQAKSELGKCLIITGMRDDIPDLLSAMDAFTLPSWREGMPRTIIEAMMMALPVVATDIRGSREEVLDGETGFIVPVRDPEKLAESLRQLIQDPALGIELGKNGRERALKLYDEKNVVELQMRLIEKYYPRTL